MNAYRLADRLGIRHDEDEQHRAAVERYASVCERDYRRMMWVWEAAAERFADRVVEHQKEMEYLCIYGTTEEKRRCEEQTARLTEDFRFCHAMWRLTQSQAVEQQTNDFAEWIRAGGMSGKGEK